MTAPERSAPNPDPAPASRLNVVLGLTGTRRAAPCGPPYSEMLERLDASDVSLM